MKFVNHGDTIEGKRIDIKTRKQTLQTSVEIDDVGRCFKYLCQIHATASITEKLDLDIKTKDEKIKSNIHLEVDDCISGDSIDVYTLDRLKFSKEANYSHKHGIQSSETKRYGRSQIRIPFRFALESAETNLLD